MEDDGNANRKIGYTAKEYASIFEKTTSLRERLSKEAGKPVTAVEIEKAATRSASPHRKTRAMVSLTLIPTKLSKPKLYTLHHQNEERRRPEPKEPVPLAKCLQKGRRESPTYAELGYELDYEYILKHTGRPHPISKRGQEGLEQKQKDSE
ncbi:MAG: hypothetical protein Q9180_009054 [Flavoplaca navasiana]